MENLINNLELRLNILFKAQDQLELSGEDYDQDYICNLKSEFINKYSSKLTEDQIDYISRI